MTWTHAFGDWGEDIMRTAGNTVTMRKAEAMFEVWGRDGQPLKPVPFPTNASGARLPHGAVLDFEKRKVALHSDVALRRWLSARNVPHSTAKRLTYLGESRVCVCITRVCG